MATMAIKIAMKFVAIYELWWQLYDNLALRSMGLTEVQIEIYSLYKNIQLK